MNPSPSPASRSPELKRLEELAVACNRCGFCTSYCPTYNATGNEVHSPRGRNQAFRAYLEGKLPADAMREAVETCLLCGECTSVCFSEVPTAELMRHARHQINQARGLPAPLRLFFEKILPYPRRMAWALKIVFLGKAAGISGLLNRSGILKRWVPSLAAADDLVPNVSLKFLLDYPAVKRLHEKSVARQGQALAVAQHKAGLKSGKPPAPPAKAPVRANIAYFPACGSQYARPSAGLATLELFRRLKVGCVIPEIACCGLPAASYGIEGSVLDLGRRNIEKLEEGHYDAIVADDTSCLAHLKEYPRFFQSDASWLKRSHDLSQKIRDVATFLLQNGLKDHLRLIKWQGGPVAFHDPCKAQYGLRLIHPPREILTSIPGLNLVSIPQADQCCGGAGTYSVVHPELSQGVLDAKVQNIIASGARWVVTTSVSCLIQVAFGLRRKKTGIEVLHLAEFLLRALDRKA